MSDLFRMTDPPVRFPAKDDLAVKPDQNGEMVYWLLDTREMWPGLKITSAAGAAYCLSLVDELEYKNITSKMFIADAKMSLASALLKRLFISKALNIPWKEIKLGRKDDPKHGKPCAVDESGQPIKGIDFNVSHQAGLVTLIGWIAPVDESFSQHRDVSVTVGADIVCVDERGSATSTIDAEGFEAWVDIYDSVFSDEERWAMKYDIDCVRLSPNTIISRADLGRYARVTQKGQSISLTTSNGQSHTFSSTSLLDAKLRRFYAYFCYKEAYIKLSGEALLAPWLKDLEFQNVRTPRSKGVFGEVVGDVEVRLKGDVIKDVKMQLQAFEDKFMLASAMQGDTQGLTLPSIKRLDLGRDILPFTHDDVFVKPKTENGIPWLA